MTLQSKGYSKFTYASPFAGFAQVALAYTCSILGFECVIVCEEDKSAKVRGQKHPFTHIAESYGAKIHVVDSLHYAEKLANVIASENSRFIKIPLGFGSEEFRHHLKEQLRETWEKLMLGLSFPSSLWLPVGSGTLLKTFDQFLNPSIQIRAVNVHVLPEDDPRILASADNPRTELFSASMRFHEPAKVIPKIPSNLFYDAKIWELIEEYGQDGDLWWNVAR